MRTLVTVLVWAIGALGLLGLLFAAGMRAKWPVVQSPIRRMNRRFINPKQLRTAGGPGAYAALVHHVGRTSGTSYVTPVVVETTPDGFVVALPYGPGADWTRNVLAAGEAVIVHDGAEHRVHRPAVRPMADVEHHFPAGDRRSHRLFGVDHALTFVRRPTT